MRRQRLEKCDEATRSIYSYIMKNRSLFKQRVFGPIAAEISVSHPLHAKFLDNHLPWSTKMGFVAQNKHDWEVVYMYICICVCFAIIKLR